MPLWSPKQLKRLWPALETPPARSPGYKTHQHRLMLSFARLNRLLLHPAPWVVVALAFGAFISYRILALVGEPAVPLDDSYIHFNYARSFAQLNPLVYSPGAPPSSGATSLGWVLVLSPAWLLGLRELQLIWWAWLLGWLSFGLLAWEAQLLARRLVRPLLAIFSGIFILCFAPFAWFAASGMEVLLFAWLLMRTARLASDWLGRAPSHSSGSPDIPEGAWVAASQASPWPLFLASFCAAITRPEGVLGAAIAGAAFLFGGGGKKIWALPVALSPAVSPLVNLALTGEALSTTASAKLLSTNPYTTQSAALEAQLQNIRLFYETLLNGEEWSRGMFPSGFNWLLLLALWALAILAFRQRSPGLFVLALALGALLPTSYWTFLVNRLRYLWPFAAAWLIALAALCELLTRAAARLRPSLAAPAALLLGITICVGLLKHQPNTVADLLTSAHAIHQQQVSMARWAKTELPANATLGVSDAGAIAYLSDRKTHDLIGLTTQGEAKYWRAGPGPRFEHYERARNLPPYLALYPRWLDVPAITGRELSRRSVWDATILGDAELVAYETRFDLLGSGEAPPSPGRLIDRLDVADLISEEQHAYELLSAHEGTNVVEIHRGKADGGRSYRAKERFQLELEPGGSLILRASAASRITLRVRASGSEIGSAELSGALWDEPSIKIPMELKPGRHAIEIEREGSAWFTAYHYWSLGKPPSTEGR